MRTFSSEHALTEFSPGFDPISEIDLGESCVLRTVDCYDGQIAAVDTLRTDVDMSRFNRATGPLAVRGVDAGDWVRVRIERIDLRGPGVMTLSPGLGVLGEHVTEPSTRLLDIHDDAAWLTPEVAVPLRPMVGIVGVATAEEVVASSVPGVHGANLDTRTLTAGASLAVRANQPGLGLAVGDLHAAMGDGEMGGTGIEIGGAVQLSVHRLPDHHGRWPLAIGADGVQVLASRPTLDDAVRDGLAEAVELMARWHRLEWDDAYRLTSVVSDLRISQVVNPRVTARVVIPPYWCPSELVAHAA